MSCLVCYLAKHKNQWNIRRNVLSNSLELKAFAPFLLNTCLQKLVCEAPCGPQEEKDRPCPRGVHSPKGERISTQNLSPERVVTASEGSQEPLGSGQERLREDGASELSLVGGLGFSREEAWQGAKQAGG